MLVLTTNGGYALYDYHGDENDFKGAIKGAKKEKIALNSLNMRKREVYGVDFGLYDFHSGNFERSKLELCNFTATDLRYASFNNTILIETIFKESQFGDFLS